MSKNSKTNMAKGRGQIANWRPADGKPKPKPAPKMTNNSAFNLGTYNASQGGPAQS